MDFFFVLLVPVRASPAWRFGLEVALGGGGGETGDKGPAADIGGNSSSSDSSSSSDIRAEYCAQTLSLVFTGLTVVCRLQIGGLPWLAP